jgi:hypothetical protein
MIVFDKDKWFCNDKRRHKFDPSVYDLMKAGYDLCHRISYYTIANGICNALNFLWYHNINTQDETALNRGVGYIAGMIFSVYCEEGIFYDILGQDELVFLERIVNQVTDDGEVEDDERSEVKKQFLILWDTVSEYGKFADSATIAKAANDLLYLLNSCRSNLRAGNSHWNRSLSSAYDPTVWKYNREDDVFELYDQDNIQITNLMNFTLGQAEDVANTHNALFFYSSYDVKNRPILYSSQNGEQLMSRFSYEKCALKIKYYDYVWGERRAIVNDDGFDGKLMDEELACINESLQ